MNNVNEIANWMRRPRWKDLRKEKPNYLQEVVVKTIKEDGEPLSRVAFYSPVRSTTTKRLVPVFVDRSGGIAIAAHEWYPIPREKD